MLFLRLSFILSIVLKKAVIWGKPAYYSIEPTNACNLACPECPTGNGTSKRKIQNIDISLFAKTLNEIKKYCLYLNLFFQGEPYLHNDIFRFIRLSHKAKIFTCISTNGHYLNNENAINTVDSGLDKIIISLDGLNDSAYKQYRINGNFDRVIDGIKNLNRAKKSKKSKFPLIEIQCLILSTTENDTSEFKIFTKRIGADFVTFKTAQFYSLEKGTDLMPDSGKRRYKLGGNGNYVLDKKLKPYCWRLWSNPVITANGDLIPCCFDKYCTFVQGNVNVEKLSDITKKKQYSKFRETVLIDREKIEICRNCTS